MPERRAAAESGRDPPSGNKPMSSGRRRTSRFSGTRDQKHEQAHGLQDARQPSLADDRLQPGQQYDRPDADAGERDADGQASAAHEPVRQEQRLRGEAHEVCAAADQDTKRCIELPRLCDRGCHEKPASHQTHAAPDDDARAMTVHDPAGDRAQRSRRPGSRKKRRRRQGLDPIRTHRSAAATAARMRCAPSPRSPSSRTRCRRSSIRSKTAGATTSDAARPCIGMRSMRQVDRIERRLAARGPRNVFGDQAGTCVEHALGPAGYMRGHDHVAELVKGLASRAGVGSAEVG